MGTERGDLWLMADDLVVKSGGAISVDTDLLRAAATQIDGIASALTASVGLFAAALDEQNRSACSGAVTTGWALVPDVRTLRDSAEEAASALRSTANLYEAVELTLRQQQSGVCRPSDDARLAWLLQSEPWMKNRVQQAIAMWGKNAEAQLTWRAFGAWLINPVSWSMGMNAASALLAMVGFLHRGVVRQGLNGPQPPVTVARAREPEPVSPPQTVADATERVPTAGETRVAIETYTGKDGEPISIVYVSGTHPEGGEDETMSWGANLNPYLTGGHSTSSAAVVAALAAAGVGAGSRIAVVGYSQGAMITERLAVSGEYDVAYAQSIGSPVEAEVDDDTTHVQLLHDDDPIVALRDGGLGATSGSDASVIVGRTAAPSLDPFDIADAHGIDEYRQTAEMADLSDDPRLVAVRKALADLTNGEPGVRYEFTAKAG